jgi:hypothetical protein
MRRIGVRSKAVHHSPCQVVGVGIAASTHVHGCNDRYTDARRLDATVRPPETGDATPDAVPGTAGRVTVRRPRPAGIVIDFEILMYYEYSILI